MTREQFIRAFEEGTKGLEAFSVGACPGCKECGLDTNSFRLKGARIGNSPLRFWDDGFGDLWLYVESLGPVGIVRADTFECAWQCVVDEIMSDADPADMYTYARSYDPDAAEDPNGGQLLRIPLAHGKEVPETIDVLAWTIALAWDPEPETARAIADQGSFSWSSCDVCESSLGGDRYPAHYMYGKKIGHLLVCVDCLAYGANGEAPEAWGDEGSEGSEGSEEHES
jgi:hypothetical protein